MPKVGEIRRGHEIGYKDNAWFIWQACESCGKERWVLWVKGEPVYTICHQCAVKAQIAETSPSWKGGQLERICETCSRLFRAAACRVRLGKARFCSQSCANKAQDHKRGEESANWKGGKVKRICQECSKEFCTPPSEVSRGFGKFCSKSCSVIYYRKHGYFQLHPNKPEQLLINLLKQNNMPFKYVGDGDVWFGNHNPDFINTNGKKQLIEVYGTYWHDLFDVAERTEHFSQYGFSTLVIWEDELADENKVLKKIKRFERHSRKSEVERIKNNQATKEQPSMA